MVISRFQFALFHIEMVNTFSTTVEHQLPSFWQCTYSNEFRNLSSIEVLHTTVCHYRILMSVSGIREKTHQLSNVSTETIKIEYRHHTAHTLIFPLMSSLTGANAVGPRTSGKSKNENINLNMRKILSEKKMSIYYAYQKLVGLNYTQVGTISSVYHHSLTLRLL